MPVFLIGILENVLAPIVAQMGLALLRERVVRSVTIVTLEALKDRASNQHVKDYIQVLIEAWKLPPPVTGG